MAEKQPFGQADQAPVRPGWATFFGSTPCLNLGQCSPPQIAFLGVPLDATTNDRPGSRAGPGAIREASMRWQPEEGGWLDVETGQTLLQGVSLADAGDVDIRVVDLAENFQRITRAVQTILQAGAFPVLVGGDHAITFPAVRAFAPRPLWVVHFDAHLDFTDNYRGVRYSHDNPLRRVRELPFVRGIVSLGVRGMLTYTPPYWEARELGVVMVPAAQFHRRGVEAALKGLPPLGDFYVSVDIDVLDPAVAPGTGYPEPGGLSYPQLKEALQRVATLGRPVGMDLTEVSPGFDPSGRTARTAAYLLLDFLGAAWATHPSLQKQQGALRQRG